MTKKSKMLEIGREFLYSLLFPPRCPVCDEILAPEEAEKGIHLACENKLYPVEGAVCMHCGRPLGQIYPRNKGIQQNRMSEHLKIESVYEYCRECVRKGYVPVSMHDVKEKGYASAVKDIPSEGVRYGCDGNKSNITQAKSLYLYKGAIKKSMYRFKYANKREYACFFARQAVERYGSWLGGVSKIERSGLVEPQKSVAIRVSAGNPHIDVIIPVPMYRPKQKQRGYNQAETFAEALSKLTGIPVDKNCIRRVKDTTPQKELSDVERKNNLENAFQTTESIVQYSHILVVDDIYTTGYTAEAVAREIKQGFKNQGECQIYVLSICIGGNK